MKKRIIIFLLILLVFMQSCKTISDDNSREDYSFVKLYNEMIKDQDNIKNEDKSKLNENKKEAPKVYKSLIDSYNEYKKKYSVDVSNIKLTCKDLEGTFWLPENIFDNYYFQSYDSGFGSNRGVIFLPNNQIMIVELHWEASNYKSLLDEKPQFYFCYIDTIKWIWDYIEKNNRIESYPYNIEILDNKLILNDKYNNSRKVYFLHRIFGTPSDDSKKNPSLWDRGYYNNF